jgi:hypothetical protein
MRLCVSSKGRKIHIGSGNRELAPAQALVCANVKAALNLIFVCSDRLGKRDRFNGTSLL